MKDQWPEITKTAPLTSKEFWATFGAARRPVIIENSVPEWMPAAGWTVEHLRNTIGHRAVNLDCGYFDEPPVSKITVKEVLNAIEKQHTIDGYENLYIRNIDVHADLPELARSVSPRLPYALPNWMACKLLRRYVPDGLVEFFLGGSGSTFPHLHVDSHGSHAFITQLQGTKHVVAAPPSATPDLVRAFGKPQKFRFGCETQTYEKLELYSATLKAGDTLYVPAGWWHTTYMTELSVSVSTNCVNSTNWSDYVDVVTDYNTGMKKFIKNLFFGALGNVLKICDTVGFAGIYREYKS